MSSTDAPRDHPLGEDGAATPVKGTPLAVDVSTKRHTKIMMMVFLAGPVIWSAHFLLLYLAVEAGCTGDGPGLNVFDPPVTTMVTLVGTAVAALACLATAWWGYRLWRADRGEQAQGAGLEPPDQGGSLAFAGFLLSLLGFVSVLFVGLPAFFLPACAP